MPWIEADDLRIDVLLAWAAQCVGDHDQDGRTEVLVEARLVFGPGNGRQDVHVVVELDDEAGVARAEAALHPRATTSITPMDWDSNGVDDLVLVLHEQLAVFLARPAE